METENALIKLIKTPVSKNKIKIKNLNINYIMAGKGKPLVLIHGANIGWGQWYPNIAQLAKFFRVYAIDLPGSGGSTKIDYLESKPDLIKTFIDVVEGFLIKNKLDKVSLIGHSIGGSIAVKVAARQKKRVNRIVLLNPLGINADLGLKQWPVTISPLVKLLSKTVVKPNYKNLDQFLRSVFSDPTVLRKELVDYYHESVNRERLTHPLILMNSLTNGLKIRSDLLFIEELSSLRKPVLLIIGKNDPMLNTAKIIKTSQALTNITLKVLENTGHVPSIEKSTNFNNLVLNFLKHS